MLTLVVASKCIAFARVLVDTWYATKDLMLFLESLGKIYYDPLKDNRQLDCSEGKRKFNREEALAWKR